MIEQAVLQMVALGGKRCSEELAERRLAVCAGCPKYRADFRLPTGHEVKGVGQCTDCGCMVSAKARLSRYFSATKLRIIQADCPLGKWPKPSE